MIEILLNYRDSLYPEVLEKITVFIQLHYRGWELIVRLSSHDGVSVGFLHWARTLQIVFQKRLPKADWEFHPRPATGFSLITKARMTIRS